MACFQLNKLIHLNKKKLPEMKQPIRIIEKTPLGYIVEILELKTRIMIPKELLRQKLKQGTYTLESKSNKSGKRA